MTFVIDTGFDAPAYGRIDYCQALQDAARDSLPHDADEYEVAAALAKLIVADLLKPKRADTARQHFARYWPLIAGLPPASYDFVFQEFAERLAEFR
jgi:hypothetical protein